MRPSDHPKPKILVVDDEPDNLDLLYRTFHREYRVLKANSGPSGLEILEKEDEVAIIISDQRMPVMSGTEFLSLTATRYPDIIRIILTGYTDVEDLVDAINSGKVYKYVTKPWDADDLKSIVKQALETHNLLKNRTQELKRSLQQETLLSAVTNTIRSAPNYREMLQRIVETVGQMFQVSCGILRPLQGAPETKEIFIYQNTENNNQNYIPLDAEVLAKTWWETLEVEAIKDIKSDQRFRGETSESQELLAAFEKADIRSSLMVPLISRRELVAVLALHQCDHTRNWADHEIQLVVTVADQAALALSQSFAYSALEALAQRERLVNTIATAIRSSLDPRSVFAAITQQLGQALEVDGCALSLWMEHDEYVNCVGLYDAASGELAVSDNETLANDMGLDEETLAENLPQSLIPIRDNHVLQRVIATQQPIAINDLSSEKNYNTDIEQQLLRSTARALLVLPLMAEGKIIGSISLRQNDKPRIWKTSEIELAQVVAVQAALAVQQSRLYQTTREQAERLLEADRLKTEFFQNISHEFRTPLTLAIGPLDTVVTQNRDLPYDQASIVLRNCRRLLRLVNQLLDLQRLDAGRMQPSFRPCDLVAFCQGVVESFRSYCQKKGISLITNFQSVHPIYLDLEKFDKVLYNLLSNAMKFTPKGGSIFIDLTENDQECLLKVRDTGIGIKSEQIPFLFDRFRQAEGSANRSYEGSGLGLALVKELVELHGGKVSVESVYGAGTTFTISLNLGCDHLPSNQILDTPAELQSSRASVELSDIEADLQDTAASFDTENTTETGEGALILVVDDNRDLRNYVSRILREVDFKTITARNGQEGFEVTRSRRPDLIITDLMMPNVSGLDLIKMIREQQDLQGTPIILLTAKADEDTRIEGVEKGADAYLSKPFNDRELLAEVKNLLALKQNERRVQELNTYLTESVLKRFLPPMMVEKAAKGELSLDLRPEPRLITILFTDIVGFTALSNTVRSRRVAELLNEYLAEMTQAVFDNGGTVDKFVGDAVMALFGAPEDLSPNEQVKRSINTAKQMVKSLKMLNERWESQGIVGTNGVTPLQFRCGIHQGTAVVGMFGGEKRSDYTAIGPSVNIAARLQEAATPNAILVSAAVADYLDDDEITKFQSLKLKGIDETVLTFTVNLDT